MPRFFNCWNALRSFALQIGVMLGLVCAHCQRTSEWVAHSIVYKKCGGGSLQKVGQRLLCSNRGRHKGCGHTHRLSLAEFTPKLHYRTHAVVSFVSLLRHHSIDKAYQTATGCQTARHAYRWLNKLYDNLPALRTQAGYEPCHTSACRPTLSQRTRLIVETFDRLMDRFGIQAIERYPLLNQKPLLG
jgi:hypothetical protein